MTRTKRLLIWVEETWSLLFGPRVVYVTTTALRGKGSWHAAMNTRGPRVIKFAVSGRIELEPQPADEHVAEWLP